MVEDAAAKRARVAGGDRSRTGHTGLVDPTRDGIGGCHWGYVTPVPRSLVDRHEGRQRDGKRAAEGTAIQGRRGRQYYIHTTQSFSSNTRLGGRGRAVVGCGW